MEFLFLIDKTLTPTQILIQNKLTLYPVYYCKQKTYWLVVSRSFVLDKRYHSPPKHGCDVLSNSLDHTDLSSNCSSRNRMAMAK